MFRQGRISSKNVYLCYGGAGNRKSTRLVTSSEHRVADKVDEYIVVVVFFLRKCRLRYRGEERSHSAEGKKSLVHVVLLISSSVMKCSVYRQPVTVHFVFSR